MPATFFNLSGKDLFSNGTGGAQHLIHIPAIDAIIGGSSLAIYDSVTVQTNETIQYFMTFDDVIKFVHFGKGIGTLSVEGTIFSDCEGNLPGLDAFKSAVSGLRGHAKVAVVGSAVFTVVLTTAQLGLSAEPDTVAKFSCNFSIINHNL